MIRPIVGVERDRHPEVGFKVGELAVQGCDADHSKQPPVDIDSSGENVRIAVESPHPEPMADDHDIRLSLLIFFPGKLAAQSRLQSQRARQGGGGTKPRDRFRFPAFQQVESPLSKRPHAFKGRALLLEVQKIARCYRELRELWKLRLPDHNEMVRILKRKRLQQKPVHGAEDCSVDAQAQCERDDDEQVDADIFRELEYQLFHSCWQHDLTDLPACWPTDFQLYQLLKARPALLQYEARDPCHMATSLTRIA